MRGLAALLAGLAAWIIVTGRTPRIPVRAIRLPPKAAVATAMAVGGATFLVALGLLNVTAAALAISTIAAAVPMVIVSLRSEQRARRHADRWPDFVAAVRSQLSGGAALPEAFIDAAHRTAMLDEARIHQLQARLRTSGGFGALLGELRTEMGDPVADRVLTTIAAAHETGGHRVGAILAALGHSVAEELQLRKAHDAAMTQQRLTAVVALIAPWALLVLTIATNPQATEAYRRSTGSLIIAVGVVATGAGFLISRHIATLSKPARVLQ